MMRKAFALSVLGCVVLLAVAGAPAQAAPGSVPCSLVGTNPGGHLIHATAGSAGIQNVLEAWAQAGFTDVTFDCH